MDEIHEIHTNITASGILHYMGSCAKPSQRWSNFLVYSSLLSHCDLLWPSTNCSPPNFQHFCFSPLVCPAPSWSYSLLCQHSCFSVPHFLWYDRTLLFDCYQRELEKQAGFPWTWLLPPPSCQDSCPDARLWPASCRTSSRVGTPRYLQGEIEICQVAGILFIDCRSPIRCHTKVVVTQPNQLQV